MQKTREAIDRASIPFLASIRRSGPSDRPRTLHTRPCVVRSRGKVRGGKRLATVLLPLLGKGKMAASEMHLDRPQTPVGGTRSIRSTIRSGGVHVRRERAAEGVYLD
jgi:hypothetical protein